MNVDTIAPDEMQAYRQTAADVLAALGTDARSGLTQTRARERLRRYGRNELAREAGIPAWRKFLGQFTDLLVILFDHRSIDFLRTPASSATAPDRGFRRARSYPATSYSWKKATLFLPTRD